MKTTVTKISTCKQRLYKSLWILLNFIYINTQRKLKICLRQTGQTFRSFIGVGYWRRATDWFVLVPKVTAQHCVPCWKEKKREFWALLAVPLSWTGFLGSGSCSVQLSLVFWKRIILRGGEGRKIWVCFLFFLELHWKVLSSKLNSWEVSLAYFANQL